MRKIRTFKIPRTKCLYCLLFYILFIGNINAQISNEQDAFEHKLNDFRYSLFAIMDTIRNMNVILTQNDTVHPIEVLIRNFIAENKPETYNYRKFRLKKYCDTNIDFDQFERDSMFFLENRPRTEFEDLNEYFDDIQKISAFMQLLAIDPINYALTLQSMYTSRLYSAADIGRQAIINRIALPKLKTREENTRDWKIWFDYYRSLYEFTYNLEKNCMQLTGVYLRK